MSKHWHSVKDCPPIDGQTVVVLFKNGTGDKDFWTESVATFCDGSFYCLEYDPHLGILRKQFVKEPTEYWSSYYTYSVDEICD
jgi:hypothetical protein